MRAQGTQVPALVARRFSKSFGGARALDDVSLEILPGEIHGLLGENGSGKSTLIKILAGYHAPDDGELEVYGQRVKLPLAPGQFRALGMDFVHQDLGLIPSLSVVENLRIGGLSASDRRYYIAWGNERRRARETFERYGLELDPLARVADILPVERALLAIVRAVEGMQASLAADHIGRGLLVLDEPTVFLPKAGAEHLFALLREIAAAGPSILFVSHNLDEVREITDRVTVLRDGRVVGTAVTAQTAEAELVEMIIGRRLEALAGGQRGVAARTAVTAVQSLTGGLVRDVFLELHRGEVLGLSGLVGSGFEEVPYLLFGASRPDSGRLTFGGSTFDLTSMTPARALAAGMALIPADRQHDGSIGSLPVVDNLTLPVLDRYFKRFALRRRQMMRASRSALSRFEVRPNDPALRYSSLSGGNQQKVLLAKWLQAEPTLLLLHEPTQGVDVGARQQIFAQIRQAAAGGASVVCASSDSEQLAQICDRVLIFARGRVIQQLTGGDVTKERISEQCFNSMTLPETVLAAG